MYRNIVGLFMRWNDAPRALQIKWVELATEQAGDYFDEALVRIVKPIEQM